MSFDSELRSALAERKQQNRYRSRHTVSSPQQVEVRRGGRKLLSFCSNDYLGLANDPRVAERFQAAAKRYGVGSGASHLVSGHFSPHQQLEEALAEFTGRPRALLFSTGYMANMGVINALTGRGDCVFEDKLNHASLIDGAMLSRAQLVRYRHNDLDHLSARLAASTDSRRKLVAVDGVFSMDGDTADLPGLSRVCRKHNAWLMVDDAHGFGCLGKNGGGTAQLQGVDVEDVPVLMGTLGKAFGTFGAFVAGSETLVESLIQFSRTYIYTTALPPAIAEASLASLEIVQNEGFRRDHLTSLIQRFRANAESIGLEVCHSQSPIQPVLIGDDKMAVEYSKKLEDAGFWVSAIRPPTVPEGSARLRVTLTAGHSLQQVDSLCEALGDIQRQLGDGTRGLEQA